MTNKELDVKKMNSSELAKKMRVDILRMTSEKKTGFIGSCYSCVDVMAVLYNDFLVQEGKINDDTVIISKGHAAAAWYAILANLDLIERSKLEEFNEEGYNMGVHPKRNSLPEIRTTTGSLGQGLGMGCGVALADKLSHKGAKTYVLLGDGECNEGSVWEAFMFAARFKLNNLIAIIDRNRLQSYGTDEEVLNMADITAKCREFGWNVLEIDGHDYRQIENAFKEAIEESDKPTVIVANTIKGKGVSAFENGVIWHYKWPEGELYARALEELSK